VLDGKNVWWRLTVISYALVSRLPRFREFLSKLGLEMRAVALSRAKPEAKDKLARQLHRLTASDEMGELFKAICFQSDGLGLPLGFRGMA